MSKARFGTVAVAALLLLGGCQAKKAVPTLNESMREIMEPNAEKIWDTVSEAYNDIGDGLVPSKLSDGDWKAIGDSAAKLKDRAELLASADHVVVAENNQPILGSQAVGQKGEIGKAWEAVNAPIVQGRIDAKPDLFKEKARALIEAGDAMVRAAQTKDVNLLYRVSSELDEVCDGCHEPFWGTDEPPPAPKSLR